jgi:hypothetical protein
MTIEFGYFPKIFLGNTKNTLFSQNININVISNEIYDREAELNTIGGLITIEPDKLI